MNSLSLLLIQASENFEDEVDGNLVTVDRDGIMTKVFRKNLCHVGPNRHYCNVD